MGIRRFSSVPAFVVLMPRRAFVWSRNGLRTRCTVEALMPATLAWTRDGELPQRLSATQTVQQFRQERRQTFGADAVGDEPAQQQQLHLSWSVGWRAAA
jgi:hypothetical protein